ncbi:flagellar basal body-associated FliL family protein [Undibacterium sp. Jales W-56]|uniref:flagellar basal body-associated FliL family protein n=1 Tax=Undibacterium sp. Jales W-56 TaxID=2897325 RepID=UPI0021D2E25F|nr:flagellar basal body-associated FliL family protein [Undibacterium sp. Jales W-56]MCU6432845.1 flagellar basal body-associated FliL family protein [Undibacterium sp. Jales W-56]
MPVTDKPKKLLTSKLDFEGVGESSPNTSVITDDSLDEWGFDLASIASESTEIDKEEPPFVPPPRPSARVAGPSKEKPAAFVYTPKKPARVVAAKKKDNFSQYAASVTLIFFTILSIAVYAYIQQESSNTADLSYLALPQAVVNVDGQVTRIQVTIQVAQEDQDWLKENKKTLHELFQIAIAKANADELRSPEGLTIMQRDLKNELNQAMGTDKIQAVLLTELLLQDKP